MTTTYVKQKEETLKRYLETGDIGSFIMMDACMAISSAKRGWKEDKRPATAAFEQKWIDVYADVNSAVNAIAFKGKEWELTHWMGFCPDDVKDLLKLLREWNYLDWENTPRERQDYLRSLWAPDCMDEVHLESWQPYFDRRDKEPLCLTHDWDHFSGETDKAKIMVGSSAGRVLVTIQDRYKNGEPESIYNGAHVTLIFDGTSKNPRGGLQSLCASREEGMGLVQHAIDCVPALKQDDEVYIT